MTQMIGQYRGLMQSIFSINLKSATLPNPIALENVMRNHQNRRSRGSHHIVRKHLWERPDDHRGELRRSHHDGHGRRVGDGQLQDAQGERLGG